MPPARGSRRPPRARPRCAWSAAACRCFARAANLAFARARGQRLLILDDDDLLESRAIEVLSATLDANPRARVAYGDVETANGREFAYRYEYSELALLQRNLFPQNAALFDVSLVREEGIAFDENLNGFEDWDY